MMANLFDLVKTNESEWEKIIVLKFSDQDLRNLCEQAKPPVVKVDRNNSICFCSPKGKVNIPLEADSRVEVGSLLDIRTLRVVVLGYVGDSPYWQGKHILRIRTEEAKPNAEIDFNNPFGL